MALAVLLASTPGVAETDAAATATRAAEMLLEAAAALTEADGARDRVEALTETVRAYEEGLLALREGVRQAALRERAILLAFEAERDRLARLLGVLQSIQSAPGPILMLHPEGPVGTARAGMIVADITPSVAREAQELRARLEELALLRGLQDAALTQLTDGLAGAQTRRGGPTCRRPSPDRRMLPSPLALNAEAMQEIPGKRAVTGRFRRLPCGNNPSDRARRSARFSPPQRGVCNRPVLGTVPQGATAKEDAAGVARPWPGAGHAPQRAGHDFRGHRPGPLCRAASRLRKCHYPRARGGLPAGHGRACDTLRSGRRHSCKVMRLSD